MITATSWLLGTLVGLGILPSLVLLRRTAWSPFVAGVDLSHAVTLFLMLGILADALVGLVFGSLFIQSLVCWIGLIALGVLVFAGAGWHFAHEVPRSKRPAQKSERRRWLTGEAPGYAMVLVGLVAISLAISAMPLVEWDARSIWFFHGKVIFFDGGLHPSDFWRNAEYGWSHKGYPPLIPLLAARAADFTLGAWNEFAPKLGLVPLACAGFLGLLVTTRSSIELALLLLAAVAVTGSQLWNGYADGWLALEGCTAIYGLARWVESGDRDYLLFGCAALAITLLLKDEAQLLFVVAVPIFLYGLYRQRRQLQAQDALIGLVFSPFALWLFRKPQLPAMDDFGAADLVARAFGVAMNWPEASHRLLVLAQYASTGTFLFESLVAFFLFGGLMGFDRISALLGGAASLYLLGIIAAYFGTPYEFSWHVRFSSDRILMLPTLLLFAGVARMAVARVNARLERA